MAEEAKPTAPGSRDAKEKPAGVGGSKLVPILMLVNSLLLAAVLALLVLRPGGAAPAKAAAAPPEEHGEAAATAPAGEHAAEKKDEKKAEGGAKAAGPVAGPTVKLPDFIVHLRDADADRYARVTFEIEVKEERAKDALNARLPQIRDAFLAYLSDRTVEELRGSEAMAQLKEALARRLVDIAPGAPVKALYVTDLVVQ